MFYFSTGLEELSAEETRWTSPHLYLEKGGFYWVEVAAVNGAGLTAVHRTDGVIVDPTPPHVSLMLQ